jgi:hypothetical protein
VSRCNTQGTHLHRVLRPICVVDLYHTIGGGIVPRSEENKSPMMHIYIEIKVYTKIYRDQSTCKINHTLQIAIISLLPVSYSKPSDIINGI